MKPLISIIIPTFNRIDSLKNLITDIINYTSLQYIEVNIIANGCTDGTQEYIRSLGYPFILEDIDHPIGFNKAFNIGAFMARGMYLISLHDDVRLLPTKKDEWVQILLAGMGNILVGLTAPWWYHMGLISESPSFFCAGIRKTAIENIGGLNEEHSTAEADFCMRLWDAGMNAIKLNNLPVYHVPQTFLDHSQSIDFMQKQFGSIDAYYQRYNSIGYGVHYADIAEHMPVLAYYAKNNHVTEFGSRSGCSTIALLHGRPKRMVTYDLTILDNIKYFKQLADKENIPFEYKEADVLQISIEPTDVLLIDSFHSYTQLSSEFLLHSNKVAKNIIMHDTVTFKHKGQDGSQGLQLAIDEFLQRDSTWFVKELWYRNNGLTVLEKCGHKVPIAIGLIANSYTDAIDQYEKVKHVQGCRLVMVVNGGGNNIEHYFRIKETGLTLIWFELPEDNLVVKQWAVRACNADMILFK